VIFLVRQGLKNLAKVNDRQVYEIMSKKTQVQELVFDNLEKKL